MQKIEIQVDGEPVELSNSAAEALQEIAKRNALEVAAAVEQAITNENFIEDEVQSGATLLIEKDDEVRHLNLVQE